MYLLLLLALAAVPGAIAALALMLPAKLARTAVVVSTLVMAAGVFGIGVGVVGRVSAERSALAAAATVSPEDRSMILRAGHSEAAVILKFGAAIGAAALLLGALCLAIQLRRLPSSTA